MIKCLSELSDRIKWLGELSDQLSGVIKEFNDQSDQVS